MSDWIEWRGGECPVDGSELVYVKLRLEVEENIHHEWDDACIACDLEWTHADMDLNFLDPDNDIVSYSIVEFDK